MNNTSDWNNRYAKSEYLFGIKPNEFMMHQVDSFINSTHKNLSTKADETNSRKKYALSIADGEGFNSLWLAQKGYNVTSLDSSEAAHKKAKLNAQKITENNAQLSENISFVCANILDYSLSAASFDLVTIFFLHINENQRTALHKKVLQILKPGGIILYECFHTDQGTPQWGPKDIGLLINEERLQRDFTDFTTLFLNKKSTISYEEKHGQKNVITLQYAGLKNFTDGKSLESQLMKN